MSITRHPLNHLLRVALLLLFLSMQSAVLAHELNQSAPHDVNLCAVCHSVGGKHDGAVESHTDCAVRVTGHTPYASPAGFPQAATARHTPEARAPPTSL